jgi:hypothetical protein
MPFLAAAIPYIAAAGAVYQGVQTYKADSYNAASMKNEAKLSVDQANAQEGLVRKQSREQLGKQEAAFGGAGVGYGGSSETALDQSAINSEMDALSTRYKGTITAYGYNTESGILRQQGKDSLTAGMITAAGSALKGFSYAPKSTPEAGVGLPANAYGPP